MKNKRNRLLSNGLFYIIVFVILLAGINWAVGGSGSNGSTENIRYSQLVKDLKAGKVKSINVQPSNGVYTVTGSYKKAQKSKNQNNTGFGLIPSSQSSSEVTRFSTTMLQNDSMVKTVSDLAQKSGASISGQGESQSGTWISTIVMLVPTLIFIVMLWMMMNQGGQGRGGGMMNFGKSHVKPQDPSKNKVRFSDVAGEEEEKQELVEIVEFLKNPAKYTKLGARIPAGVLLEGPPGTGKTLLARAVAGEAGVPFYSISGSDFVEMFVGTGASRVRDMFKTAQKSAPCIIFIDEIDAVGRQRGAGMGGGNDEREQTLNQLLVEMDGMTDNAGIVVIAATNRPDVLDPALLRSGRFDRRVTVSLPDIKGREAILHVHARNKKLANDVSLANLAKRTPGFSGADLANVLNEGAILAVRKNEAKVTMTDLDEAIDRVMMGPAKKSKKYTEKDKILVAYHEAGHAVIGLKLEDADMVQKVTIIPRGDAGGYNLMTPREEKYFHRKSEFIAQITGLLGGRTAEEIQFGEISAGAVNDIEKLTEIAKNMVRVYGMSSLGPIQYADPQGNVFLGRDYTKGSDYSAGVAAEIDKEVRAIVDECHENCRKILTENKDLLDLIANNLYEHETLTNEEITNLMNFGQLTDPNAETVEVEEKEEQEEVQVPKIPEPSNGVDQKDLDDAFNELTKKKD